MDKIEKIKEILAKKINVDNLGADDDLSKLGLDSLDLVEIVMDVEEVFGVQFEMDEIKNFRTINDVVKSLESK